MHLLFLTPQLPHPPRQGTAIRNWGLIRGLADRHSVTLLTLASPAEALSPELRAACQQVEVAPLPRRSGAQRLLQLIASPLPDLAHRLASPHFASLLARLLETQAFDAVVVEGLELAPYLFPQRNSRRARVVFDAHNCETVLQRRAHTSDRRRPGGWLKAAYSSIQAGRLAGYEASVLRQADWVTCVSAEDAAALQSLAPGTHPVVVPNGVFLDYYARSGASQAPAADDSSLVFSGKMDYRPNVDAVIWFADEVLPAIRSRRPQTRFVIVGQSPAEAVRKLAGRPGITVTGAVDDARPYISSASVYVAPLRMGGGTRFKLLEAFALKCPVVSTPIGAEGFAVAHDRELLLADTAERFAQSALTLLEDQARGARLKALAYEFVKAYDWEKIVPRLEALLTGAAPNEQRPGPPG